MDTYEKTISDFVEHHGKDGISKQIDLIRYFAISHPENTDHVDRAETYTFLGNIEKLLLNFDNLKKQE